MKLRVTALNTYAGIWTFLIFVVQTVFFILLLLWGYNWLG